LRNMAVIAACLALLGCNNQLPTEPIPTIQYCTVIKGDINSLDTSALHNGTELFGRINYLTSPATPEYYISDGNCGPASYPSGGWSVYVVNDGHLILVGW
jgi:hypothetical protein